MGAEHVANHPRRHALWKKGENPGTRISNHAAKAIRLARRYCPEAVMYAYRVLKDENETTDLRLRATKLILDHGMPKGDTAKYLGEETIGAITLNLVMPKINEPAPPPLLTLDTIPVGSGD